MVLPKGIIIDCACVVLGTNLGAVLKEKVPEKIKDPLTVIFGICAIAIGVTSLMKMNSIPAVILALILGTLIGELVNLDTKVRNTFQKAINKLNFKIHGDHDEYMKFYLIVAVTLCASGTNIFGAINEGITGDMTILVSKAVMDIFAATIFGATLGRPMNIIAVVQFVLLCICFYMAKFIAMVTTPSMMNDFIATGGLLTFVLGLSIAKIKHVSAVNLLPALIVIWPSSYLFTLIL